MALEQMTLRKLRVWHWEQCLKYRKASQDKSISTSKFLRYNKRANFHIGCVQSMNDIPELIGTTAEQDLDANPSINRDSAPYWK